MVTHFLIISLFLGSKSIILSKTHFRLPFWSKWVFGKQTTRKNHFQISCVSNRTKTSGIPRFLQKYHFGESLCMLSSSTKITILSTKLPFSITIFNLPFCSVSTNKFLFQKYHFVELPFCRARTVNLKPKPQNFMRCLTLSPAIC